MKEPVSKADWLAEYVSQGMTVQEAGKLVGWNHKQANGTFQRIRRSLGEQAV